MALKKAIGEQMLAPFELYTCLLEVANHVNQRPIGPIPNDPVINLFRVPATTAGWSDSDRVLFP